MREGRKSEKRERKEVTMYSRRREYMVLRIERSPVVHSGTVLPAISVGA